jgi:hypothetical protein
MPPAYVKPYVKRHKNDVTDAEAICEAVTRPNMGFIATKTPEQQSCLTLHRTRHLFIVWCGGSRRRRVGDFCTSQSQFRIDGHRNSFGGRLLVSSRIDYVLLEEQMKIPYLLHSVLKGTQQWIAATWPN